MDEEIKAAIEAEKELYKNANIFTRYRLGHLSLTTAVCTAIAVNVAMHFLLQFSIGPKNLGNELLLSLNGLWMLLGIATVCSAISLYVTYIILATLRMYTGKKSTKSIILFLSISAMLKLTADYCIFLIIWLDLRTMVAG